MKKALMYIGGYRQLKDFIWYYLYKGKNYDWDLVCQPMFDEMPLKDICERTGIFHNIYMPEPYITQKKARLFLFSIRMIFNWLVGKSKQFAAEEAEKICNLNEYSLICLSTTRGVTPGLIACAAEGMELDLLEDGIGDNTDAGIRFELKRILDFRYTASYLFAKMGYFNIDCLFPLKSTKKFARYSNNPEELSQCLYRSIHQMNDMPAIDIDEYKTIIEKTFEDIGDISDADAVLFSARLMDFNSKLYLDCNKAVAQYLYKKKYKKVIFKRHPRDYTTYKFESSLTVDEIEPYIPAEDIISLSDKQDLIFMYPSASMLEMNGILNRSYVLKFNELSNTKMYVKGYERAIAAVRTAGIDFTEITV